MGYKKKSAVFYHGISIEKIKYRIKEDIAKVDNDLREAALQYNDTGHIEEGGTN